MLARARKSWNCARSGSVTITPEPLLEIEKRGERPALRTLGDRHASYFLGASAWLIFLDFASVNSACACRLSTKRGRPAWIALAVVPRSGAFRLTLDALRHILPKTTEMQMRAPRSRESVFRYATSADPLREAFLRRSMDTITRIAAHADLEILAEALAASTGFGTLARVLADSATIEASVVDIDPLAPLVARNAEHRIEILAAAGGALSSTEVARQLGVSRQAIEKRRRANALLAVRMGGDWRYPRCQFDETKGEVVSGLPKLLGAFAKASPWVVLDFLLAPDEALGNETPMQTLQREGLTPRLERLARIEQGDGFA